MKFCNDVTKLIGVYLAICIFTIALLIWGWANIVDTMYQHFMDICLGSILGGLGTLFAVYLTNKRSQEQLTEMQKGEANMFVNEICDQIGEYIADLCEYVTDNSHENATGQHNPNISRKKALALRFSLRMKLHGIPFAKDLINEIVDLYDFSSKQQFDIWKLESKLCEKIEPQMRIFKKQYIEATVKDCKQTRG